MLCLVENHTTNYGSGYEQQSLTWKMIHEAITENRFKTYKDAPFFFASPFCYTKKTH